MAGMKRLSVLVTALACAAACSGAPSTAPTATAPSPAQVPNASRLASDYTTELLNVMQTNSINRDRIN